MTENDEENADIQVKDIQEEIGKHQKELGKPLTEILRQFCDYQSRIEAYIEIEAQDVKEDIEILLKKHRHLPDGTVVEPI